MLSFFKSLIILAFSLSPLVGKIVEVARFEQIEENFPDLDENSLVIWDVDCTLIVPEDAILRPCGQKLCARLTAEVLEDPSVMESLKYSEDYLKGQLTLQMKRSLLDEVSPDFIRQLQERGIPTISLTAASTGTLGPIACLADWRIGQLKSLGFDFSEAFPALTLVEFPYDDKKFAPLFKSGVLFSSKHPKGVILREFLEKIHLVPTKVIFIDDQMSYLKSVERALEEMGIEFYGIHYTAAEKLPSHLDERVAIFQFLYLVEQGEWLSDGEAKSLIDKSSKKERSF